MTRAMRIEYNKDKHKKGFHTKNKHHVNALRYCLVALKECELAKFVVMRHAYHRVHRPKTTIQINMWRWWWRWRRRTHHHHHHHCRSLSCSSRCFELKGCGIKWCEHTNWWATKEELFLTQSRTCAQQQAHKPLWPQLKWKTHTQEYEIIIITD